MPLCAPLRPLTILLALLAASLPALPQLAQAKTSPHQTALVVVLDPGHGGTETGAVDTTGTLAEKTMTLAVAKAARKDLKAMGYTVYLTRTRDQQVNAPPRDLNHDGKIDHIDEFDARNLFTNSKHADVFVSIHFDGSTDPSMHGTHGYYCPARPFWKKSRNLADILTASVATSMQHAGYASPNNGVETDVADVVPQSRADYPWFLVLGPSRPKWLTGTAMPGALVETLFMSSPRDDIAMRKPAIVAAIARGYAQGIRSYFDGQTTR